MAHSEHAANEVPGNAASAERARDNPTTDRAAQAAHETIDRASEIAGEAEREVRSAASDTAERVKDSQEQAKDTIDDSMAQIRSYVDRNPLASIGIAFAAGIVVSALLRR